MIKNSKNIEKKTKIALICYSLSIGGIERVVSNYSYLFTEMGMDVHIYIIRSETDYSFSGTLHQFDIEKHKGIAKIRKYQEIMKSIRENHFDFIIDHRYRLNPISEFFWQHWIYRQENVINYIHSSKIGNYLFSKKLTNALIFRKRTFVCVSKGIEEKINQIFPSLKTKTIYNFVTVHADTDSCISELHDPFILAVARIDNTNVKQIDVLLECFAKSKLPAKNYKLMIIGSGERKKQMENLAEDLQIDDKVIFMGYLTNPYAYFSKAKFTTLTSKYEGLGVVLIESLMLGTPVVSYDCESGPREIIINEENGLLIKNQDKEAFIKAMERLAEDEKLYQKLKAASKKSVEKFTQNRMIQQWKDFLGINH
ncbi:glycosyltransferase [Daejeonia sp. YH14]|uniref:glycosyltransferase n=1 Tax=Daejeonia sp. YH14 TaxID=3439042 RepID=UPI003F490DF9